MFHAWLVFRQVTAGKRMMNLPSLMSLIGMTIGVACLVVAMGVISGFETTLRNSVIDVFGHVLLVRKSEKVQSIEDIVAKVKAVAPSAEAFTPFVQMEGVLAHNKRVTGIVIQGVDPKTVEHVLNIRSRVIEGAFELGQIEGELPPALVGKGIQRKFALNIGDTVAIVLPTPSRSNSTEFSPRLQRFRLAGVLDLGKSDYDERYVVTDLKTAQAFAQVGENFSGIRIKLGDANFAARAARDLQNRLGSSYFAMDWEEVNKNLFEAVKLERVVIFFVLLVLIIAASFNISSQLFVSVLQRFQDISILKAMGFSQFDVLAMFSIHGLFFGLLGTLCGLVLGGILCVGFVLIQKVWVVMPADVYKLDHVGVVLRPTDVGLIIVAAMAICLVSTLTPAWRGSKLNPVEGLRYE